MIVTFKSAATADIIYFGDVAKRMMELMGKAVTDQGIVTVEQLPGAIARLAAAIAGDQPQHREHLLADEPKTEAAADGGPGATRPFVSLTRRALPLLEMLKVSLTEKKPVVWGV
ncbi:MAG: DUF1840 domain-containing protein [Rhodocyclaceae bacterium]|nr:DUF1840 domain-containing protein [Rhodocyclaceae bacterium]